MIIANKYKLIEKISNGEFGYIFKGENIRTKEEIAIKLELVSNSTKMLKREAQIYQFLGRCPGLPHVKWYGSTETYNYMVLPLFGNSLSSKTFSLNDSLIFGVKMVYILKCIHEKGLIHRDIKPDNFVFDKTGNEIFIIDFGLCKRYLDNDDKHIECKSRHTIIGTPNFVSLNVHNGVEPSRRDDLTSIAYILLHIINGELPWANERKINDIKLKKMCIHNWSKMPREISEYLKCCENLRFDETPNYDKLISFLQNKIET
jgi:serine/threonine protein kinase